MYLHPKGLRVKFQNPLPNNALLLITSTGAFAKTLVEVKALAKFDFSISPIPIPFASTVALAKFDFPISLFPQFPSPIASTGAFAKTLVQVKAIAKVDIPTYPFTGLPVYLPTCLPVYPPTSSQTPGIQHPTKKNITLNPPYMTYVIGCESLPVVVLPPNRQ